MAGYSTVVGLGGFALIGLNYWDGPQRSEISPVLTGQGNVSDAHTAFKELGVELVFVVVATVLGGLSDSWGMGMTAVIVALFILWAIQHTANPKSSTTSSPAKSSTGAGTTVSA
jgi:hypothetical protein